MNEETKTTNFIYYLKCISVTFILLCHCFNESKNIYLSAFAQVLNIGVQLFFIISGFCFGLQGEIKKAFQWYKKRIIRIYPSYEIFIVILAIIYIVKGLNIEWEKWASYIIGIPGIVGGIQGISHAWFITSLLLCYLFVPFISKINKRSQERAISVLCLLIPMVLALFPWKNLYNICYHCCFFWFSFLIGKNYQQIRFTIKRSMIAVFVIGFSFLFRLVMRFLCDGTDIYNYIVVSYTHYLAAYSIFYILAFAFLNSIVGKFISFICKISYEIYLCHYMFVVGPVSLMELTPYFIFNVLIIGIVSLFCSCLIYYLKEKMMIYFTRKQDRKVKYG